MRSISLGRFIYTYRVAILFLLVPLSVIAFLFLSRLQFKSDFSKFFPEGNPDWEFYEQYASHFGNRDDYLSIGIQRSAGVFEREFLTAVQSFADTCRTLAPVRRAFSVLSLSDLRNTPFGLVSFPLLDPATEEVFRVDSAKVMDHPLVKGQLIAEDGSALLVLLEVDRDMDSRASQAFTEHLHALLDAYAFEEAHIIGTMTLEINHIRLTSQEMLFFIKVCTALIIVLLLLMYGSFPAMFLPLMIFLLSMIFLGAELALAGISLDTMSTMLPTILLIVSISDVIHLFGKIQSSAHATLPQFINAFDKVAWTNFLTSLTTAIGFLTLVISPMPTLVDFGISVALGVMTAYVLSTLLVPLAYFFLPMKMPEPKGIFSARHWQSFARKNILPVLNWPRSLYLGLLALVVLSGFGIAHINYDRYLTSTMPYDHEIRDSYRFFEDKFGGSRELDIAVTATEKGGLSRLENLLLMDRLERYLDSMEVVGGLLSPNSFYRVAQNILLANDKSEFSLPGSQQEIDLLNRRAPPGLKRLFTIVMDSTLTYGAIRGHMHDIGMARHLSMMQEVDDWLTRQEGVDQLNFRHTGIPMVLDTMNILQVRANFIGLLIAVIIISLLIALLFRRWFFILVILMGNLLPLILVAGVMGLTDIEMRGSTSLIFSVAFVIIVDDTLHFLSDFMQYRGTGLDKVRAIEETVMHTGHPIVLTTLVLAAVTLTLLWSSLPDVRNLGFLLSVALLLALVFDLLLIPLLLKSAFHGRDHADASPRGSPAREEG